MKLILVSCLLLFSYKSHAQSFTDLLQQAAELFQKGEYEKAIPYAEKAGAEIKKFLGEDNVFYQAMLTIQGFGYAKTFQYNRAESIYLHLCSLNKDAASSDKKQNYSTCLNNLATLYVDMGLYEKAEPLLIQSAEITKSLFGANDSTYTYSLNNLAGLYQGMGQFQKAEPLYMQAMNIRKKTFGEQHPGYATSLNNLGTLYMEMGLSEQAEPYFSESMAIRKRVLGESNIDYAMSLNNLAALYEERQEYAKAEPAYLQANAIRKKIIGESHPDYALGLNNLAGLYTKMGQFKKAEVLIVQAMNIWKTVLGENHPNYATSLNNLAAFYRKSNTKLAEAERLYKQGIELRKRVLGNTHPLAADSENDLGLLYIHMGQYSKAAPYFLTSSQTVLQNMLNSFTVLSEKEKGNCLDYNFVFTESNHSLLYNYPVALPEVVRNSFNLQLGFKSLSLSDTRNVLESVRDSKDTTIQKLLKKWQVNKIILAKQYSLAVGSRMPTLKQTEVETENIEKELNRLSSAFRAQQTSLKVSQQDVQKQLAVDEAAIEFVRFRLYKSNWADSIIYAAYILRKDDAAPRFVRLFEERQLQKLYDSAGRTASGAARILYRGLITKENTASMMGQRLYEMTWKPLEPFLKGVKKISYSPAGKLFGIAFHALPVDSNQLLIDKYQLQQYTSTRQIALRKSATANNKPGSIVLFGDASFTMDSTELVSRRTNVSDQSTTVSSFIFKERGARGGVWDDLPGTAEEIKQIGKLFRDNKISTITFVQSNATEENLKKLTGQSPQILHVATHGFFLPVPEKKQDDRNENIYSLSKDPLLRSGLVLAGGNYVWGGKRPLTGIEDGIATAYEISQLNLSNTDLVVLSACETALGDVKGSEGVFGLQRSFKMAGVKNLVVSLWQVPDRETVELMAAFYSHRMAGKPVSESFNLAQADMRKKYPPFYWAAFVLVE